MKKKRTREEIKRDDNKNLELRKFMLLELAKRDMNYTELSRIAGISSGGLSQVLSGDRCLTDSMAKKIENAIGISLRFFVNSKCTSDKNRKLKSIIITKKDHELLREMSVELNCTMQSLLSVAIFEFKALCFERYKEER